MTDPRPDKVSSTSPVLAPPVVRFDRARMEVRVQGRYRIVSEVGAAPSAPTTGYWSGLPRAASVEELLVIDARLMEGLTWRSQKPFETAPVMEVVHEVPHE